MIYVAVSRVQNEGNLQVLGFTSSQLLKPPREALEVCSESRNHMENLSCSSNQEFPDDWFQVSDRGVELMEEGEEDVHPSDSLGMDVYPDGLVSSFFEKEKEKVEVNLETVFLLLDDHESQFSRLPEGIDLKQMMKKLLVPNPPSDFAKDNNISVNSVLQHEDLLKNFAEIQWHKIFELLGDHLANNPSKLYLSRKDLSDASHNLYVTIIGSVDLRQESRALFQVEDLSPAQISIASSICLDLFEVFVNEVSITIEREHAITTEINFDVEQMPKEGLAKLRHVGGWAFRKELEKARRYMRANMFSLSSVTRQSLNAEHAKCSLLEEHVIVQYAWIKENTTSPETLEVTENRQFRERGLLHISDPAYNFILKLEILRVELLNTHRIKHYEAKTDFVENALKTVLGNQDLKSAWNEIFREAHPDKKVHH